MLELVAVIGIGTYLAEVRGRGCALDDLCGLDCGLLNSGQIEQIVIRYYWWNGLYERVLTLPNTTNRRSHSKLT